MIPRIAQRGHSFKGAGLYYLHDKGTDTQERVRFTQTLNLPMNDPDHAMRFMAYTAMQAEAKKRAAGISTAGAKQKAGAVYAFSLSWHPTDTPDSAEMMRCVHETLSAQGLSEHEAVCVAHDDTEHPHIHVIVNLVHPITGKIADLSYSKQRLSQWARAYEQQQGMIHCPEREKNAQRREHGQSTKYHDERHAQAEKIALFFEHADSGAEFITMLDESGLTLARGDKGRIVIVDAQGDIQNITRQLPKGTGKKAVLAKLSDVDTDALPFAADIARERKAAPDSQTTTNAGDDLTIAPDTPPEPVQEAVTEVQPVSMTVSSQKPQHVPVPSQEALQARPSTQHALDEIRAFQHRRRAHLEAIDAKQRKAQALQVARLRNNARFAPSLQHRAAWKRMYLYCKQHVQRLAEVILQRRGQEIRMRQERVYHPAMTDIRTIYHPKPPTTSVSQVQHEEKAQKKPPRPRDDYPRFTP